MYDNHFYINQVVEYLGDRWIIMKISPCTAADTCSSFNMGTCIGKKVVLKKCKTGEILTNGCSFYLNPIIYEY